MKLIEHLEQYLGLIEEGWKIDQVSTIRALRFNPPSDPAYANSWTLSTLGLSDSILRIGDNKLVRQELLFTVNKNFSSAMAASSLVTLADHIKDSGKALLRGETIGPGNNFTSETQMNCIYICPPVIWHEDLHIFNHTSPPVVFVWVLPVYYPEHLFILEKGWNAFEDLLEHRYVDFGDMNRPCLI